MVGGGNTWSSPFFGGSCCAGTAGTASSSTKAARLTAVRARVGRGRTVVWRFLRNTDVMGMTLLHRRRRHLDEAGAGAYFLDIPAAAVPQARPQSADQVVDEWGQLAFVGYPALNAFRHHFRCAVVLSIT